VVLLVTLIMRPTGITGGKEIAWPTDWHMPSVRPSTSMATLRARFRGTEAANEPAASAETPAATE
jgi:hypothetical protein